jgi:hypothetical protein
MKLCTETNEALCSEGSQTYLQVSFESLFSLTELLDMAAFRNFKVLLGQTDRILWYGAVLYHRKLFIVLLRWIQLFY